MRPYFQREGVVLYLGDCAEMRVESDLIITDPPYGRAYESGRAGGKWGEMEGDRQPEAIVQRPAIALDGLRRGRHVYIFKGDLDLSRLKLCGITELIWDKGVIGMGDLAAPWGPQHEAIIFATYESSEANRKKGYGNLTARLRKGSVLRSLRPNSRRVKNHPTEKPVDILRQMIESSSVIGEKVYDPFAGSGSTLIAAVLEGRQAIGFEIDERYCEIAAKRLENECVEWRPSQPSQKADKADLKANPARSLFSIDSADR